MAPRSALQNPNYMIELIKHTGGRGAGGTAALSAFDSIIATLPEELSLNVQSEYEARYANLLTHTDVGSIIRDVGQFAGFSVFYQALTSMLWIGSDGLELSLQMLFDAETDPRKDVTDQIAKLQSWVLPTISESTNLLLFAPGPTPMDPQRNQVSVHIGRFLTLDSVIIPSAASNIKMAFDKNGQPISASVDVTIRTYVTPYQQQFLNFFGKRMEEIVQGAQLDASKIQSFQSFITGGGG